MQKETRDEIVKGFAEEIKALVQTILENLMREERELYLEQHPTKANGYYTRDLLTLAGPLEDLKVLRARRGFSSADPPLPEARFVGTFRGHLTLYAVGVSTRNISRFLEGVYGAFYSPQSISRLLAVTAEQVNH